SLRRSRSRPGYASGRRSASPPPRGRPGRAQYVCQPYLLIHSHDWPDLDRASAWPAFGHVERLIEVGYSDLGIASDDLVALNERPVADDGLAVDLEAHSSCSIRRRQLVARADLRRIFGEPATDTLILGVPSFLSHRFPGLLLLAGSTKQKHVLHAKDLLVSVT